jgi:uncharacterized membrane protein
MVSPTLKKTLVALAIVFVYSLLNYFIRMHLPGISNVDIRPQIVLIFVAGYFYGPVYGFFAGFIGNLCTDLLFGYGLTYLPSWTIGNGLIGALMGLFPYRKCKQLDRIGQLVFMVLALILVNGLSLAYAAFMESIRESHLTSAVNFHYFYVPALLSNVLGTLILFPAILLFSGRLKKNFPVKIALANYYLTIFLLIFSWIIFALNFQVLPESINSTGLDINKGNALVDVFNHWSLLLVTMSIISFFVSSWLSKTVVTPLKQLEDTVYTVLKGDPTSAERLTRSANRQDEVGILSYTVKLLSEKLWETQKLFRDEMKKRMKFMDSGDSGTDVFIVALISLFGKDVLENSDGDASCSRTGEISNLSAISLLVSAGGLRELATTYSDAKIEKSFEGLYSEFLGTISSKEERQAIALAIDLNLLFKGRLMGMNLHAPLDHDFAFHLLEKIQAFRRSDKKYIGYVTQQDIISKLQDKWEKSAKVSNEKLEQVMKRAVTQQIIRGYQIKNLDDLANFDEDLKIIYSHSAFKHVKQLIGLLVSENIQAKIQLEPKHSSFIYLDEWETTPDLNLEKIAGGFSIAHKHEFDVVMEFAAREQRDRFREIIEAFAKRESSNQQNLLFDSWYQPLYCSEVPVDDYYQIANLSLGDQTHVVHVYCKKQDSEKVMNWLQKESPDLNLSATALWVNDAFYRYLGGDYK